jgi:hypothetical protein
VSVEPWSYLLLREPTMTSRPCSSFRSSDPTGAISSIPGARHCRPEPGPRRPAQVGGHQREGHWGHRQARESDEFGHGQARRVAWSKNARDVDRSGRVPSRCGARARVVDGSSCGALGPRHIRVALPGAGPHGAECGWASVISDEQCDELEGDCPAFARDMADTTLKDLELLPQDELEDPEAPRPSN